MIRNSCSRLVIRVAALVIYLNANGYFTLMKKLVQLQTFTRYNMRTTSVMILFAVLISGTLFQFSPVQAQIVDQASYAAEIKSFANWQYMSSMVHSGAGLIEEANIMAGPDNLQLYSSDSFVLPAMSLVQPEILPYFVQEAYATPVSFFGVDVIADDNSNDFQRDEVSITVNPTNPMNLVSVSHRVDTDSPAFIVNCEFSRSLDMGATWGADGVLTDPKLLGFEGDPSVASDSTGKHYYACQSFVAHPSNNLFVFRSVDGGVTWINPAAAGQAVASVADVFHDKLWVTADQDPSSPCKDIVYLSWTRFSATTADINIVRSTDMGVTWSAPLQISTAPGNQISYPFVAPGTGHVYVSHVEFGTGAGGSNRIMIEKSTNCGLSFTAPQIVDGDTFGSFFEFIDESNSRAREPIQDQGCVDGSGLVQVVWRDFPSPTSTDSDIHYSSSPTGLTGTWSAETVVNAVTTGDQFFPTIHCQKDQAHVAWGDQRADTLPVDTGLFDVFYRSVLPGPAFGAELGVTDVTQDATAPGFAHFFEPIAGDYFDSTVNDQAFHVVWTDFRIPDPDNMKGSRFVDKGDKRVAPPVVGGDILPLETTALLAAGIQTSAMWLIPLLAGIAGVGVYLVKTRTNKE